jgi:hypothetical protein
MQGNYDRISGVVVNVLALNGLNGEFPPNLVKPKNIKLEFAVSPE